MRSKFHSSRNDGVCVIDDNQLATKHFSSRHEFHDTRHRNVTYTAVATTRFKEYFPDTLTANPDNVTRTSQPVTISVLNSARPAAPKPLYIMPAFGWEQTTEGSWTISRRSGGALRVYLDRPWFSSGEGELLAAVLWGCAPPPRHVFQGWQLPDFLKGYVTQWGKDPIWSASALPTEAMPLPEHFLNRVAVGTELTLDELSNGPFIPLTAVGHSVAYDDTHGRKLWYCDIQMDSGEAYFPFIRLALARYQPNPSPMRICRAWSWRISCSSCLTGRPASCSILSKQHRCNWRSMGSPRAVPVRLTMTATLQMQPAGGGDLAWTPVSVIALVPHTFAGPDTLWTAQFALPAPRGSRPFRLLIEEFEIFTRRSWKRAGKTGLCRYPEFIGETRIGSMHHTAQETIGSPYCIK